MTENGGIDLARTKDFSVGRLVVRPSLRQLVRDDGTEEVLEPRVMQVLVALARADGGIVTRSDLSESCWENRIVGEDAINRVISRLRRIPDGIGAGSFKIETVTKIGYRLVRIDAGQPPPPVKIPQAQPAESPPAGAPESVVPVAPAPDPAKRKRRWLPFAGGLAGLVLAAIAAIFLWHGRAQARPTRIAVLPFDVLSKDDAASGFASALTDQILTGLNSGEMAPVSRADAMTLRGNDNADRLKALQVGLVFDGTVQNDGKTITVQVHVNDPQAHVAIWSSSEQGTLDTLGGLRARVTRSVVGVLACSNRALKDNGLTDPALLARYLRACDLFVNQHDARDPKATFELLDNLRVVTKQAPNFVAAHSDLAKFEAYLAPLFSADQAAAMRAESKTEAEHALALDPKAADAYLALEMALPPTRWQDREALLRKGVAEDPDWPHTNGFLAQLLAETGRSHEAVLYAAHAAAADLQIDWRPASDRLMCMNGGAAEAIDDLKARIAASPGDGDLLFALGFCYTQAGRFEEYRAMQSELHFPPPGPTIDRSTVYQRLIAAMISKTPADREAARQAALAWSEAQGGRPFVLQDAIEALAQLGFLDDAFSVANRYSPGYPMTGIIAFMFDMRTAPMRRDPRFLKLAAKWGLLDFWRQTGKWPDFCADPTLPYRCKG